jgi:hemerythrin superfamily protein
MGTVKTGDRHGGALELLLEQHDTIEQLIAQLTDARISDERKAHIFRTLADTIAAHAAIEETIFYPAVRERATCAIVREALRDHAAIKRELADLVLSELDDPRFAARLQILRAQIEHHARDQEEGGLFPRVRELMDDVELARLGARMRALFEQLLSDEPALDLPRQARAAAVEASSP